MKLPNAECAVISFDKVVRYLLNPQHPGGTSKAVFFRTCGFRPIDWGQMAEALKQHAEKHDVVAKESTPFGTRFVIDGPLETPDGRSPLVRCIWFVETGDTAPRLVSAYPIRRPRG